MEEQYEDHSSELEEIYVDAVGAEEEPFTRLDEGAAASLAEELIEDCFSNLAVVEVEDSSSYMSSSLKEEAQRRNKGCILAKHAEELRQRQLVSTRRRIRERNRKNRRDSQRKMKKDVGFRRNV